MSKVLLDTCVVISASVYGSYQDLGVELEHKFYSKTTPLFYIIKKYQESRVGIITSTIESQSIATIAKAVTDALEEKAANITDPQLRDKVFESHTVFFDQCLAHLFENLLVLPRESISQNQKDRYYPAVTIMYNNLRNIAKNLDINQLINANVTPRYRNVIRHEVSKQYRRQHRQLLRLKDEPVEESDKIILCEAICLLEYYRKTMNPKTKIYVASTDYHFSPCDSEGEITEQIKRQFDVVCDWPDEIANNLKSDGFS
jgi:hypothetical protein